MNDYSSRLFNFVTGPYFIALVLFLVAFLFIPTALFNKYTLKLNDSSVEQGMRLIFYEDLDSDGNTEMIKRYIDAQGMNAVNIYLPNGTIMDQFNFGKESELYSQSEIFTFDRDQNGYHEIYELTYSNDSIFLSWIEPFTEIKPHNKFITKMRLNKYGRIDFPSRSFLCVDLDMDGNREIITAINGGYSKYPRKVYAYDYSRDSIYSSPFTGASTYLVEAIDINNDGLTEIVLNTHAYANIKSNDSILDDEHSYLMVLDNHLNFYFEPIPFYGFPSSVNCFTDIQDGSNYLYVIYKLIGATGEKSKIMKFNSEGKMLKQVALEKGSFLENINRHSEVFIYNRIKGEIIRTNNELDVINKFNFPVEVSLQPLNLDLSDENEFFFYSYDDLTTIGVCRNDFTEMVTTKSPVFGQYNKILKFDVIENKGVKKLHVQKDEYQFIYDYKKNNLYYLKYPFYVGIYLVLLTLVYLIQRLQQIQSQRKIAIEKQISELQLKTIKNQMDPHFTFNAINTVGSLIYQEDRDKAYRYFTKFSRLVRSTLNASDKITRSLIEELEFVENYLSLEKIRYQKRFDYKIDTEKEINSEIQVPKMIIQIYAENAVKHGLKHKPKDGLLK
ncbi:MAG: histidine kinase, partial [Bacteroidales bacterium]|nr:histidine kinase [Bacteroidales bacterium]